MSVLFKQYSPSLWVKQNEPFATNTGIILSQDQACLIDPGISQVDCIHARDFLRTHNAQPVYILLTHAHWDHLLGPQYFPETPVITHEYYLKVIGQYSQQLAIQAAEWFATVHAPLPRWKPPVPDHVFSDTMDIEVGSLSVRLRHAPGHTEDHVLAYLPSEHLLWAGDMLSDRELPLVSDVLAYQRTLEDMRNLEADTIVPGHGSPTADSAEISERYDQDETYAHLLHQCVGQALANGLDIMRTIETCLAVPFSQPDTYPNGHKWNIESAYTLLGGICEGVAGWEREWPAIAKS